MPEFKSISCVHCGDEVRPQHTWTEPCICCTARKLMPNPENRLQDILKRLHRVSGDMRCWCAYRYQGNGV